MKNPLSGKRLRLGGGSAGSVLLTIGSNFGIQGTNILTGILTARSLGPHGRGSLAAIIMWPQFLAYLCTLGLPLASVYCIRRWPEQEREMVGITLVICCFTALIGSCVGFLLIPRFLHNYSVADIAFARHIVFLAPLSLLALTLSTQVQAAGRFAYMNLFRLLGPVTILVVLLWERIFHRMTPRSAGLAYLLAGIPVLLWNAVWIMRRFRPRLEGSLDAGRKLLSYGVRVWGADLLGAVANQVDRLLLVGMLAPEALGLYVVSQGAANVLNAVPSGMASVVMPKATDRDTKGNVALIGQSVRLTFILMLVAALPLLTIGGYLLRLVYGAKFLAAGAVLRFLVLETIFDGLTNVLAQGLLAAGLPGIITVLQGFGLLTAIPLLYVFIPRYGIKGAGIAILLSTLLRFTLVLASYPWRLKVGVPQIVFGKEDVAYLVRRFRALLNPTEIKSV